MGAEEGASMCKIDHVGEAVVVQQVEGDIDLEGKLIEIKYKYKDVLMDGLPLIIV